MKQKHLYIIAAGFTMLVFAVIIFLNISSLMLSQSQQASKSQITPPPAPVVFEEPAALSIEDIKGRPREAVKTPQKEPTSLAQVYSQYSKEDAGGNMVTAWAKVNPEEKTKVFEQLDLQITQAQAALKASPADKKAKHILFISQTLKKLCNSNFDYKLLEFVPKDSGGAKPGSKK